MGDTGHTTYNHAVCAVCHKTEAGSSSNGIAPGLFSQCPINPVGGVRQVTKKTRPLHLEQNIAAILALWCKEVIIAIIARTRLTATVF